jgi:ABC-type nitrate/sulfonate/bicarbonate transport system ATPase subunit
MTKITDATTTKIAIRNVTKQFQAEPMERGLAITEVSFDIKHNEFVSIVGRSGCGKTTLLNMVAGLLRTTSGEILIDGKPVNGSGPDRGMVFQNSALFPWLTAIENIEFGPKNMGVAKHKRRDHAQDLIELVRLTGFEKKYPRELSGGMRQRVAIARALAMDPDILLMDEPFGALDELTRSEMQDELLRIWEARKKTVVFVTHSIFEALYLSDKIVVLSPHPGRMKKIVCIDMPRPRQRSSKEFLEHYEDIHAAIF